MMESFKINKKKQHINEETEMKIKEMDKKIKMLEYELWNVSTLQNLKEQNMKIAKFTEKIKPEPEDRIIYPDIFRYFWSLQGKLTENADFAKITDALKNEVYEKMDTKKIDENTLLQYVTLPEKVIYSQWILQILTGKLSEKLDHCGYDSLETLMYLRKILTYCNVPVPDAFPSMLSILNNTSSSILSDNEQDLLIFMHVVARMQSTFELIKTFDVKKDGKQFFTSKNERCELQKRHIQFLNQLKHFIVGLENINIHAVFNAITKSNDVQVKAEEITEAFENFKKYVIHVSGQTDRVIDSLQDENTETEKAATYILQKIDYKIQHSIQRGIKESSENFDSVLKYDLFQEDVKKLVHYIKDFSEKIANMSLNGIEEAKKILTCLKIQADFTLQRKWDLQKQILPFVCNKDKALHMIGLNELLLEHIQDTMFNLKILEEMEFNREFPIMYDLCQLKEKKDLLTEKFRHFILRIGYQKPENIPIIKKKIFDFNKEIQILLTVYHKFRFKLQYFDIQEEKNLQNMLADVKALIMSNMNSDKDKKNDSYMPKKKITLLKSEVDLKKTKDTIEEISKSVDETVEFLHSLDETIISQKFPAMRYLCELHCLKEQLISSFEDLFYSMSKLDTNNDYNAIIEMLNQVNSAADSLVKRYETVGAQLILFSDIMEIVHYEKSDTVSYPHKQNIEEIPEMNISDLFGATDEVKKLYFKLDNAAKSKWFPAKRNLCDMLKEKEKLIASLGNFFERMPELNIENTMKEIHTIKHFIINSENILRKYQSLRLQLIWIAGECVFSIINI